MTTPSTSGPRGGGKRPFGAVRLDRPAVPGPHTRPPRGPSARPGPPVLPGDARFGPEVTVPLLSIDGLRRPV